MNKICGTQQENQGQTQKRRSMDMPVLADQQELIYISSVWTQDVV